MLSIETDRLIEVTAKYQPIDAEIVMCYAPQPIGPATENLARLTSRVDLLEAAVQDGRIEPAVTERILDTIKSDLAVLSDEKNLKRFDGTERTKARSITKHVAAALARISQSAGKPAPTMTANAPKQGQQP